MPFWRRRKKIDMGVSPPGSERYVGQDPILGIRLGMTRQQVVEVLGPPWDYMDMTDLLGTGTPTARMVRSPRSSVPDRIWWIYFGVPDPGLEINITFQNGRVADVRTRPYEQVSQAEERQDWARELLVEHLDRAERQLPKQLVGLPAWQQLASAEVLEFVVNTHTSDRGGALLACKARRFGDLDLIVSLYELADAEQIRGAMSGDYRTTLAELIEGFGLTELRRDIAHWILGRTPDGRTIAHLAYVPSARDVINLLPTDLLPPNEG